MEVRHVHVVEGQRTGDCSVPRPAVLYAAALAVLFPSMMWVLPIQWLVVGSLFLSAGVWALRHGVADRWRWFAVILSVEGILFLAYVPLQAPVYWGAEPWTAFFQYSSFFDAGADLLLALATLVALDSARTHSLESLNEELRRAHERLRRLVDLDPLTGVRNRRALREVFEAMGDGAGSLIFVDIDDFKSVNDRHGHAVGDACLVRVAETLRQAFRPHDEIFRWGGDEFLVVAPGLETDVADRRVERLRRSLERPDAGTPPLVRHRPDTPSAPPPRRLMRRTAFEPRGKGNSHFFVDVILWENESSRFDVYEVTSESEQYVLTDPTGVAAVGAFMNNPG